MQTVDGEFTPSVADDLARRACYRCGNPSCRASTLFSLRDASKVVYLGNAAQIQGVAKPAHRFDKLQSMEDRCCVKNGIHLCLVCHKIVDSEYATEYTVTVLRDWKQRCEAATRCAMWREETVRTQPVPISPHVGDEEPHISGREAVETAAVAEAAVAIAEVRARYPSSSG